MEKTKLMLEVEGRIGEPLETFLGREYNASRTMNSMDDVSARLGISYATVYLWLGRFGYHVRTRSEVNLPLGFVKPTREQLERWYWEEELSPSEILRYKLGGKVSLRAVKDWFKYYSIKMRTKSEAQILLNKKVDGVAAKLQMQYETVNLQYDQADVETQPYKDNIATSFRSAEPVKNNGRNYDDIEYRRQVANRLLKEKRKTPDRIYTRDFIGGRAYSGLLNWYVKNHNCTKPQAKDLLVEDIFGIKPQPLEKRLEAILRGYASP